MKKTTKKKLIELSLPEVEVIRRALEEYCVGKRIIWCDVVDDTRVISGISDTDLAIDLYGKIIDAVLRKGKILWFQVDSRPYPIFQFGRAGAFYIKDVDTEKYKMCVFTGGRKIWPSTNSKIYIKLSKGVEISFEDERRSARVRLIRNDVPPISELGPDALNEPMKVDEFSNALRKRKAAIKTLLLNQSFISGIGNWTADEVLYQARIHPMEKASDLSKENCETLLKCIKEVFDKAIAVGADSSQYPDGWIVRYRGNKPAKAYINGRKIDFIKVAGEKTAFVPELQKLSGPSMAAPSRGAKRKRKKYECDESSRGAKRKLKKSEDDESSRGAKRKRKKSEDDESSRGAKRKRKKSEDGESSRGAKRKRKKSEDDESSRGANRKRKKSEDNESSRGAKKKRKKSEDNESSGDAKRKRKKSEDNESSGNAKRKRKKPEDNYESSGDAKRKWKKPEDDESRQMSSPKKAAITKPGAAGYRCTCCYK